MANCSDWSTATTCMAVVSLQQHAWHAVVNRTVLMPGNHTQIFSNCDCFNNTLQNVVSRFLESFRSGNVCLQLLKRAEPHVALRLANMGGNVSTVPTSPIETLKWPLSSLLQD